jgi:hypothetical protein
MPYFYNMEYYRPMASQYLQPQRQHVTYSPNKQTNGTQQVPATSMYTTSSGFQTFQTVLTPTYTDANGEHVTKIEPHDGEHQQLRVLMPVQNATGSGTQIKFVDASGAGNSVIFSTSNGSYAQNGTIVYQNVQQQHPQQYQTIQVHQPHGQIGHQIVNGQIINGSTGQGHFSNPVQYIVVQSAPNPNNTVPIEIKNEIESPTLSSQEGGVREVRRAKDANRKRRRRLTESEEEAMARRQKNLEAKRRRLARETEDERRRRRQRDAEAKRKRRERETEEQRLARLKRDSERMRRTRRLKNFRLQQKDGDPEEIEIQAQQPQQVQQSHSQSSHQPVQHTVTVSNAMHHPQPRTQQTRIIHHPKQEPTSYLSSNSSAAINQTIAAVVDNKHSNMVVLDQKPIPQGAFITSTNHPHTIQIPANSMVQTVAVPQGMLIPSSQGGHGVQQIILLPPSGQPTNAITIPPGTQIIHQRHPDSSSSSVSSSFITEQQQSVQQQQQRQNNNAMLPDDPTERQRIRNKERARRRRALETPEQRALRNMKTAERMRRRRAQLAEQRALEHGISQPVKVILTDEEYNHRFEDIFAAVLKRADYEVENNGPIVPRAKLPPGYQQSQEIFVNGDNETYVIEHIDSSELQTDGEVNEEIEYKPSLEDEEENTNGADDSNHHDRSVSSVSHDEDEDIEEEHHESQVQQEQMLQRL